MHLPILSKLRDSGRVALVNICDVVHDRAAAARHQFGFREHSGDAVAALHRKDIDAVYIFASAQVHFEYGLLALKSAKHLFVEKPIAPSYAQALALAKAAQEYELIAVGGHNRRFYKALNLVRARAGKSGWRSIEATLHKPEFGKSVAFGAKSWLTANGIHALDAMLFMMGGLPAQLAAAAGPRAERPSVFSALMQWSDGAQGVFLCNNDAGSRREEYVFHGAAETFRVTETELLIDENGVRNALAIDSTVDGIAEEHDAFLRAIFDGSVPPHAISRIAPSLYVAELIENGHVGRVDLPADTPSAIPTQAAPLESIVVVDPGAPPLPLAHLLPRYRITSAEEIERSADPRPDVVAMILGKGAAPLTAAVLSKLPNLRVVGFAGLSLRSFEPEALLSRGIALINASAAYAGSVAEFALGLAILGRRRAFSSHELMRKGGWGHAHRNPGPSGRLRRLANNARPLLRKIGAETALLKVWRAAPMSRAMPAVGASAELRGAVVGIIGWGDNAKAFTELLKHAGARVIVHSQHATEAGLRSFGAANGSLGEVLAADIVSLHRGLTPRTRHFLGEAELAKLRPGTVLINVARGALIEPQALRRRLERGDLIACLDTFETEPLPAGDPLRRRGSECVPDLAHGGWIYHHASLGRG
jgi:phosphoglycerate dehydrogenase-like enzyme/predicted dehydrogenase